MPESKVPETPEATYRKGQEVEMPEELYLFFKGRMSGALELIPEEKKAAILELPEDEIIPKVKPPGKKKE